MVLNGGKITVLPNRYSRILHLSRHLGWARARAQVFLSVLLLKGTFV